MDQLNTVRKTFAEVHIHTNLGMCADPFIQPLGIHFEIFPSVVPNTRENVLIPEMKRDIVQTNPHRHSRDDDGVCIERWEPWSDEKSY